MTKLKHKTVKTTELIPYARNAKKHSEAQVAQIAGSIKEFGFNNPVLIDAANGIIAGHGRVLAAHKLELESVPCVVLDHLTDTQKRAYIIADNRLAETGGGWDLEMLKLEAEELELDLAEWGLDELISADTFDAEEVSAPELKDGDRNPFRQVTFTLHDEQWEEVEAALATAKQEGGGESAVNENSNGNALAWVCGRFNRG
jgi:ParB-like chromosome segregation protein Spo0J